MTKANCFHASKQEFLLNVFVCDCSLHDCEAQPEILAVSGHSCRRWSEHRLDIQCHHNRHCPGANLHRKLHTTSFGCAFDVMHLLLKQLCIGSHSCNDLKAMSNNIQKRIIKTERAAVVWCSKFRKTISKPDCNIPLWALLVQRGMSCQCAVPATVPSWCHLLHITLSIWRRLAIHLCRPRINIAF